MNHPILDAVASIEATLKSVADVNPTFMTTDDKDTALRELVRAESMLAELQLRILPDAGDVAERTAARDIAEWLTTHTRTRHEDARADLSLAIALDRRWTVLSQAMRDGSATVAQAQVIARALDALPSAVPADVLARAEEALVGHAAQFGPRALVRLGRRVLDAIAPEIAEEAEARRLAALEAAAHRKTRLRLRRVGDGTTRLSGRIPDAVATRLATYLGAFTNPRKEQERQVGPLDRLTHPRRLGEAFCQLLETLEPRRLPVHGGNATTVMVTISLDALRERLATAGILDLGRSRRLFTAAQRKALLLRDRTCRAEGCDIPGTWAEAHHWDPWSTGGRTDLADGVLLCHHHHQRVHDDKYQADRLANGDVRFHRRT